MDVTEWMTAGGTVAVPVFAIVGLLVRPILKKLDEHSEEIKAHRGDIDKLRDRQDGSISLAKEAASTDARALKKAMEDHERTDGERFDDMRETFDAKIGGLRKENSDGLAYAVQQIKADQTAALEPIRNDIRALSSEFRQRLDSMMAMFATRLGATRTQAGDD